MARIKDFDYDAGATPARPVSRSFQPSYKALLSVPTGGYHPYKTAAMLALLNKLFFLLSDFYVASNPKTSQLHAAPASIEPSSELVQHPQASRPTKKRKTCAASAEQVASLAKSLDMYEKRELLRNLRQQLHEQETQSKQDGEQLRKLLQQTDASTRPARRKTRRKCRRLPRKQGLESYSCSIRPFDAIFIAATVEPTISDQLSTLPIRVVDLRPAYLWFWTVSCLLVDERRCDDAEMLSHSCSPLELVLLLAQGWLSPSACTAWKEARYMVGKGLLELAHMEPTQFHLPPISSRPSAEETYVYIEQWRRGRAPLDADISRYDWESDAEDRVRRGPFGPALLPYGDVGTLERAFALCTDPETYVHTGCLPGLLGVLLAPLFRCRHLSGSEPQEKTEIGGKRSRPPEETD